MLIMALDGGKMKSFGLHRKWHCSLILWQSGFFVDVVIRCFQMIDVRKFQKQKTKTHTHTTWLDKILT